MVGGDVACSERMVVYEKLCASRCVGAFDVVPLCHGIVARRNSKARVDDDFREVV